MSVSAEAAAGVAGPNTTPVEPCGRFITGRCATVEYHGSAAHAHGLALLAGDCDCDDCWDEDAGRVELRVRLGSAWFTLLHVRLESFTCACPDHGPSHTHPTPRVASWRAGAAR
jgi:hypothetical protein